jgi:acetyltransferase
MLKVSRLVEENPEIVELDLNPVIIDEHSAIAVDARIVVHPNFTTNN